jgi:hypothetical protein
MAQRDHDGRQDVGTGLGLESAEQGVRDGWTSRRLNGRDLPDKLKMSLGDRRAATSRPAGGKPNVPKAESARTTGRGPKPARPTKRRRP